MNESHIIDCVNKAKNGIEKYRNIQNTFRSTDVSVNIEFQTRFNHFYRVRQKNKNWYSYYYCLMEDLKRKSSPDFQYIIKSLFENGSSLEASFSSKMLATLNTDMPVWDKFVLNNLKIKPPSYNHKERMALTIHAYSKICNWYKEYVHTEKGRMIISIFNDQISNYNEFSNTKKIDFVLWQNRSDLELY